MMDEDNISYSLLYGLDHTDTEKLNVQIQNELNDGNERYLFGYSQLTSNGNGAAEHMQSFKYAYQLKSIRSWLLNQTL